MVGQAQCGQGIAERRTLRAVRLKAPLSLTIRAMEHQERVASSRRLDGTLVGLGVSDAACVLQPVGRDMRARMSVPLFTHACARQTPRIGTMSSTTRSPVTSDHLHPVGGWRRHGWARDGGCRQANQQQAARISARASDRRTSAPHLQRHIESLRTWPQGRARPPRLFHNRRASSSAPHRAPAPRGQPRRPRGRRHAGVGSRRGRGRTETPRRRYQAAGRQPSRNAFTLTSTAEK